TALKPVAVGSASSSTRAWALAASNCSRSAAFSCIRRPCQLPAATNNATAPTTASTGSARGGNRGRLPASDREGAFGIATPLAYTRARMKIIVIAALVAVVASLFSALYYLYRDRGQGTRMVRMLTVRVVLSAMLVAFLVISYRMGWIAPTGLRY